MVGGSSRNDGVAAISSNIFAALEGRKRKSSKKKIAEKNASSTDGEKPAIKEQPAATQFWAPQTTTVTSWADCDEDDDDYFATTAPPPLMNWGAEGSKVNEEVKDEAVESEDDGLGEDDVDDGDDEVENDEETAPVAETQKVEPAPPSQPKETERQLSKKELKKQELAKLDAVLAEMGLVADSKPRKCSAPVPQVHDKFGFC